MTNEEIRARMWEAYKAGIKSEYWSASDAYMEEGRARFDKWLASPEHFPELLTDDVQDLGSSIVVPALGIDEEVTLTWVRNSGDIVVLNEVIAEFDGDKATFELTAERSGVLEISTGSFTVVSAGDVIGLIKSITLNEQNQTEESVTNQNTMMEVGIKVRTWTSWSESSVAQKGGSVPRKGILYTVRSVNERGAITLDEVVNQLNTDGLEPHFDSMFFTEIYT